MPAHETAREARATRRKASKGEGPQKGRPRATTPEVRLGQRLACSSALGPETRAGGSAAEDLLGTWMGLDSETARSRDSCFFSGLRTVGRRSGPPIPHTGTRIACPRT
jgi:hypothetical protein